MSSMSSIIIITHHIQPPAHITHTKMVRCSEDGVKIMNANNKSYEANREDHDNVKLNATKLALATVE